MVNPHKKMSKKWLVLAIAALSLTGTVVAGVIPLWRDPTSPTPKAADENFQWGLCVYPSPNPRYKINSKDLDRIASAEMNWLALDFAWSEIEPLKGHFNFTYYDWLVDEAMARGIGITGKLANTFCGLSKQLVPNWITTSDPRIGEHAADYIAATVDHFKDRVKYWQVGNEENKADFDVLRGERNRTIDMEQIHQLLKNGADAIRREDQTANIMLSVATEIPGWIDYLDLVTNVWNISYDIVAIQSFPCTPLRMCTYGLAEIPSLGYSIKYEIEAAKVFRDRVIVSQAGYFTRFAKSENPQADFVKYAVKGCIDGGGEGFYFYCYMDDPKDSPDVERHLGLLRCGGTPKPAWHVYKEIIENPEVVESLSIPPAANMAIYAVDLANNPLIANFINAFFSLLAWKLSTTQIGRIIIRHILVRFV